MFVKPCLGEYETARTSYTDHSPQYPKTMYYNMYVFSSVNSIKVKFNVIEV